MSVDRLASQICCQLIDLLHDVSKLGTKEISLEPRVVFRLDIPLPSTGDVKSVAIKAPCQRQVRAALMSVLRRYGLDPTQHRIMEVRNLIAQSTGA